jgi:hypothetical protein
MPKKPVVKCDGCERIRVDWFTWIHDPEPQGTSRMHGVCPECIVKLYPRFAATLIARHKQSIRHKSYQRKEVNHHV